MQANFYGGEGTNTQGLGSGNVLHSSTLDDDSFNPNEVDDICGTQFVDPKNKKKGTSIRGGGYTPDEDKILCSAWLNVSKDAGIGTNQSASGYYKRMHDYFLERSDGVSNRSQNSITNRWGVIQKNCSRFSSLFAIVERRNESGKNDQDRVEDAKKMFQEKEPWHFQHCWEILRYEPKWNARVVEINTSNKTRGKKTAAAGDGVGESENGESNFPIRPEGRDSVKKKRAKWQGDTSSSSAAVEMLQKMHHREQEQELLDAKRKDDLLKMEQVKVDLIKEQTSLQRQQIECKRLQAEQQLMFAQLDTLPPAIRDWVRKKQMDILTRDGVVPRESSSGP